MSSGPSGQELLKATLDGTRPEVAALLGGLRPRPDAVLFDFATSWVCAVAAPLGVTPLYFSIFAAAAFAYITVPARRLHASAANLASALAGFPPGSALATAYIDYIASQLGGKPVLLAGLVVPEPPQGELEEPWAAWLSFPNGAVVFAVFGSETFLPAAAATELLLGLEATGRPFLVVLNFPMGADAEA
ncbi:hypothetical protein ACP4OV_030418 [Aristida adscensionis]